ncbi:MAG: TetR/AcrR family transcriptional regulator [Deltaproteobacteria bacterium]|nr:TetR/AcrR family transcriptional regulator [Deltaproteobacteria bacterium]
MARPRQADPAAGAGSRAARAPLPGTPVPTGARLAANQIKRMRRIVDAAVALAEGGGFEAVRLRDVAERSDVALGTLYKYFRSKEDILLFALDEEVGRLEQGLLARPPAGASPFERAADFFGRTSRALIGRPALTRAMIRALTGTEELAFKVAAFQLRIARLVAAALRGAPADLAAPLDASIGSARERAAAQTLMHVWFSALVGWSAGLHTERGVVEQVRVAAELVLGTGGR